MTIKYQPTNFKIDANDPPERMFFWCKYLIGKRFPGKWYKC